MAKVRLVAFRKGVGSGAAMTSDQFTSYELDLKEFPNISVNYQFSDIKEPDKRKGSFSQTFKLPFTPKNDNFFENWYDYNVETQYFSTREKFNAVLYVGTVPQIEGFIQLKGVYKKAQYYEVVIFSNAADLFTAIGENTLKDVFKNENGSYDDELNHTYNAANLALSWNGASAAFQNTAGVSLRDADAGVQKVMYPMSVTQPNRFVYPTPGSSGTLKYLANDDGTSESGGWNICTDITQFKPAIQLKYLIKRIVARAGFSLTSTFIDGDYFGKLFMTTGGHLGAAGTSVASVINIPSGNMVLGRSATSPWGVMDVDSGHGFAQDCSYGNDWLEFGGEPGDAFDVINDPQAIYNSTYNYYTKKFQTIEFIGVKHVVEGDGAIEGCDDGGDDVGIEYSLWECDEFGVVNGNILYQETQEIPTDMYTVGYGPGIYEFNSLDLSEDVVPTGTRFKIKIRRTNWKITSNGSFEFTLGHNGNYFDITDSNGAEINVNTRVHLFWDAFDLNVYNSTIDVPSNIDPEITQAKFLKDIIQRFNLVVTTDPDNPANIRIEPYNDYIGQGSIKYWTDKLDLDKEIIVRDTTSLQKKHINFTDLEDVDLYNKEFKEDFPIANVYGHYKRQEVYNQFAKGELKNEPIFSPYINSKVFDEYGGSTSTYLPNMTVQYEYSYDTDEYGGVTNELKPTKPKLFYYCGTPTTVIGPSDATITYYMHSIVAVTNVVSTHSFTTYPVCTPWDITPSSNAYTLTSANRSLYWNGVPPLVGDLTVFNWDENSPSLTGNALYGRYWRNYLDGLYGENARLMECYLNLDAADIYNFKFNDEIFIKDAYWRIISINNYQVGERVSTKVTLLKVLDSLILQEDCRFVVGELAGGDNTFFGYYVWCAGNDPDCTPTITPTDFAGLYANPQCCVNVGGEVQWGETSEAANNRYMCQADAGSRPLRIQDLVNSKNILGTPGTKNIISGKKGGLNQALVKGNDTTKYSKKIIPSFGDDIVIKYNVADTDSPQVWGENHRIIITGYTQGTTTGYAYPRGDQSQSKILLPPNSNCRVTVNSISTVVGGTSSTHVLGSTETVEYTTAYRNVNGVTNQIGTTGGNFIRRLVEGVTPVATTLYLDVSDGEIRFGLKDSQADTKRTWTLKVDLDIQLIPNIYTPIDANWALYQNSGNIGLQNNNNLLWN